MKTATRILFVLGWIIAAGGCGKSAPPTSTPAPQSLPTVSLTIGNRLFTIEVAADRKSQATGLMHRDSMPADHGMIFVFPDEQPRGFWMQNTRIPLDIVYLDSQGTIVSILPMQPLDLRTVPSGKPAMYAIELNQGIAAAVGLKVGDKIPIPPDIAGKAK